MVRASIPLALVPLAAAHPWAKRAEPARLIVPENENAQILPDQYIVKFSGDAGVASLDDAISALSITPDHVYSSLYNGFSATLDAEKLEAIRSHPQVEYVEQDMLMSTAEFVTQPDAPWGLARLSNRAGGATGYVYDDSAGAGTCSYVLDTGVEIEHPEFEGRATFVETFVGEGETDGSGHGTHVAGTIGSVSYGVAKKTHIYSIKVLGASGSGSIAGVVAGMDHVAVDSATRDCPNGVFVNLSLGVWGFVTSVDDAVASMVNEYDIFVGVAGGNDDTDVYFYSPANSPGSCTVAATGPDDARTEWSNFGGKVAVLAPGLNILSTWPGGTTNTISGTSMATPHVVGLAAYLAGLEGFPGSTAMCQRIKDLSTKDIVTNLPTEATPELETPNRLAFNGNPSG